MFDFTDQAPHCVLVILRDPPERWIPDRFRPQTSVSIPDTLSGEITRQHTGVSRHLKEVISTTSILCDLFSDVDIS